MQSLESARGRFVWHELMTHDVAAAAAFYGRVVGLDTEPWGEGGGYLMWKTPSGAAIGGVMTLPEEAKAMGAPPHWFGNVCVPDVDAAAARVAGLGGKVLRPAESMPGVGRFAVVADPAGATLAFYRPEGEAPGHAGMPTHGEISWSELMSGDPAAAWAFYEGTVGWVKTEAMEMGPEMGSYQMFGPAAGVTIGGYMKSMPGMPSAWLYYFHVPDLDGAMATAKELGATLIYGPQEIPGGDRVAALVDPQGAAFALHGK